MKLVLHQTHHTLADFESIYQDVTSLLQGDCLHIFPELFLSGYPLQDLILTRSFIDAYENHQERLNQWLKKQVAKNSWQGLMGGVSYEREKSGLPRKIQNVIYAAIPGVGLRKIYAKRLLPNYDIFDEQKYFTEGHENCFYEFGGKIFGLQICEDMWASSVHELDPCQLMFEEMKQKNLKLEAVINLSASPFDATKNQRRITRANNLSLLFECPFIYVNRVGGEDEVLFDGGSFIVAGTRTVASLKTFEADNRTIDLASFQGEYSKRPEFKEENTWEGLFTPHLDMTQKPVRVIGWSEGECREVLKALQFGFQEYARKSGFKNFLVALSGGIDSALVLAIVKLSLKPGQMVEAIYMPSIYSSSLSTQLCEDMCRKIEVPLRYLPIKFLHSTVKNTFGQTFAEPFDGLTNENVQSRLRGMLLYTRSNQTNAMVINTSNKSELAVGYSTQYGDSVGAISLLGDLFKSEVYQLSEFLNKYHGEMIPKSILDRGPSAELRENQLDQDSLPPYSRLDAMLEGILSYHAGKKQLEQMGFDPHEVTKVLNLYAKSEYKRAQFCPILKVKSKSFGFGYRIPISKNMKYLTE
jgi:NAD+ synthase (glutamine-hydrolysing)